MPKNITIIAVVIIALAGLLWYLIDQKDIFGLEKKAYARAQSRVKILQSAVEEFTRANGHPPQSLFDLGPTALEANKWCNKKIDGYQVDCNFENGQYSVGAKRVKKTGRTITTNETTVTVTYGDKAQQTTRHDTLGSQFRSRYTPNIQQPVVTIEDHETVPTLEELKENIYTVLFTGYQMSCMDQPRVFVQKEGQWQEAVNQIAGKGGYFIDDEYHGYGMCDIVSCLSITRPFVIQLVEYVADGERYSPYQNSEPGKRPVYRSIPLTLPVKVEIDYYLDGQCTQKTKFIKEINSRE